MSTAETAPRRVAVTGVGVVSSIGNDLQTVEASLRAGKSGIRFAPEYAERGFRSHVEGAIDITLSDHIDRRLLRFMGAGSGYAYVAAQQAIENANLKTPEIENDRTGLIIGSGGPSTSNQVEATRLLAESGGTRKIGPYMVPRCMSSTVSANLATAFKVRGASFSISSACSTGAHCIFGRRPSHPPWRSRYYAGGRGRRTPLESFYVV